MKQVQLNSSETSSELSMSSQSNKDLTGLSAQGRASCPKRRKTSFAGLIKRERHRGIAKEGHGRLILLGEDESFWVSQFCNIGGCRVVKMAIKTIN